MFDLQTSPYFHGWNFKFVDVNFSFFFSGSSQTENDWWIWSFHVETENIVDTLGAEIDRIVKELKVG